MTIYGTLSDARAAAVGMTGVWSIAEIEHAAAGRCYIITRCSVRALIKALASNPIPEIRRVIAEHPIRVRQEVHDEQCARCGRSVPSTAYHQTERWRHGIKVIAYYCDDCHRVLSSIGQGEYDGLKERAGERADNTPHTPVEAQ